ncbi:M15 family metallopeptidase [Sporosalibacterium faouarense]|uniref:M15 family metallopeptidase n=1 Tax=Sporosalibacterium faouarense TaxID=516123 RepID=UPI00141C32F3|nr:M15 family metallopeptidase [Sporosalibacterium faouarense]MTI46340.1 M15 family metallopeptidase [Bacillota bacterium]
MCVLIFSGCSRQEYLSNSLVQNTNNSIYDYNMKRDLLCLMIAYPNFIIDVEQNNGKVYIKLKSGMKVLYDDKKQKNFSSKLQNPDIQDMMEQPYPLGKVNKLMDENFDPGRIRVYPILKEVYGSNKSAIESNLSQVSIGYKRYAFNNTNNAAKELKAAIEELNVLSRNNWKISTNIAPSSGTYNYRYISGTGRLSPHAFGIAVDLKRDNRDYWKWATKEQGEERIKEYPVEIVNVFEKHNFVWGGKWSHFDILHFEYRPEIILKARYFGKEIDTSKSWYDGVELNKEKNREYIQLIEKAIE